MPAARVLTSLQWLLHRCINFCRYGQFKRITGLFTGALTGKG